MHRAGVDVGRWPRYHDDVLDWSLRSLLRARDINCVIDVGGNVGHFGQLVRTLGYEGRIVSFEPSPTALPTLNAAAARDRSWVVRAVGLSCEPGAAQLHLHEASELDSLLTATPDAVSRSIRMTEVGTATVNLSTLAIELPQAIANIDSPRVLLKSDTQGHDFEVLKGAEGSLPSEVVAVLVELSAEAIYAGQPRLTRVMDFLMDDGFSPVAFQPISQSPADGLRIIELDGLFMRPADGTCEGSWEKPMAAWNT
jgi:FkbM family methyltransferase